MDWPDYTHYSELFPSIIADNRQHLPEFPSDQPVWSLLDPNFDHNLKKQLEKLIESIEFDQVDLAKYHCTKDETKGKVVIHPEALLAPFCHFIGPCFIGKGAQIRHGAYIRENSWICQDSVVGHSSEIKHSILLPKAKAPHFNYVGDSILGSDTNLGAGTKLSNLRNDGGTVNIRINDRKISSGLRKFGAILGENCQLGCNSVTNPGTILGVGCSVLPNVTVTGCHGKNSQLR